MVKYNELETTAREMAYTQLHNLFKDEDTYGVFKDILEKTLAATLSLCKPGMDKTILKIITYIFCGNCIQDQKDIPALQEVFGKDIMRCCVDLREHNVHKGDEYCRLIQDCHTRVFINVLAEHHDKK